MAKKTANLFRNFYQAPFTKDELAQEAWFDSRNSGADVEDERDPTEYTATNRTTAQKNLEERTRYREEAYPQFAGFPTPIDIWYNKGLYGKIDEGYNAVITADEWKIGEGAGEITTQVLKKVPTESGEVFVMNFVVDAFVDLRNYMYNAANMNQAVSEGSQFIPLEPKRGWHSFSNLYRKYYETLYQGFGNIFLDQKNRSSKLRDFSSFMKIFSDFLDTIMPDFPITATGMVLSKRYSLDTTGLIIELLDWNHGNDRIKYEEFISDPNFLFFVGAASRFGFRIDKNAPWRLVADIKSAKMHEYMSKYPLEPIDPGEPIAPQSPCDLSKELFDEYIGHKIQFTSPSMVLTPSGSIPTCTVGKIREVSCEENTAEAAYFNIRTYRPGSDEDLLDELRGAGSADFDVSWLGASLQARTMNGATGLPSSVAGWHGTSGWKKPEMTSTTGVNRSPDLTIIGMAFTPYAEHADEAGWGYRVNWMNSTLASFSAKSVFASLLLNSAVDPGINTGYTLYPAQPEIGTDKRMTWTGNPETIGEALYGTNPYEPEYNAGVVPILLNEIGKFDEFRWTIEFEPLNLDGGRRRRVVDQALHSEVLKGNKFPADLVEYRLIERTEVTNFWAGFQIIAPLQRLGVGEFYSAPGTKVALRPKHETAGTYIIKVEGLDKTDPANPIVLVTKFLTLRTSIFYPSYKEPIRPPEGQAAGYRRSWQNLDDVVKSWNTLPQGDIYKIPSSHWTEQITTTTQIGNNPISLAQFYEMLNSKMHELWRSYKLDVNRTEPPTQARWSRRNSSGSLLHATTIMMTGPRLGSEPWDTWHPHDWIGNDFDRPDGEAHLPTTIRDYTSMEDSISDNWLYYFLRFLRMNRASLLDPVEARAGNIHTGFDLPMSPWNPITNPAVWSSQVPQSRTSPHTCRLITTTAGDPIEAEAWQNENCVFQGAAWQDLFYHHLRLPYQTDNYNIQHSFVAPGREDQSAWRYHDGDAITTSNPRGTGTNLYRWRETGRMSFGTKVNGEAYEQMASDGSPFFARDADDLWPKWLRPVPPPISLSDYMQDYILLIQLLSIILRSLRPLVQYMEPLGGPHSALDLSDPYYRVNAKSQDWIIALDPKDPNGGLSYNVEMPPRIAEDFEYFEAWASNPTTVPLGAGGASAAGGREQWTVKEFLNVHGVRTYDESPLRGVLSNTGGRTISRPYTWEDAKWAFSEFPPRGTGASGQLELGDPIRVDPPIFDEFIGRAIYRNSNTREPVTSNWMYIWMIQGAVHLTDKETFRTYLFGWDSVSQLGGADERAGHNWDVPFRDDIFGLMDQHGLSIAPEGWPGQRYPGNADPTRQLFQWPPHGPTDTEILKTRDLYQALVRWVNRDVVVINPSVNIAGTPPVRCLADVYRPAISGVNSQELGFVLLEKDNKEFQKKRTKFMKEITKYLPLREKYDKHVEKKQIYDEQMIQWNNIHNEDAPAYGGPLSFANLFIRQFEHTMDIDIPLLKEYLQDMYNSYVMVQPVGLVATVKTSGTGTKKCIFNRPLIKMETIMEIYSDAWWAEFYYKVRVKESRKDIDLHHLKNFKMEIANILSEISSNSEIDPVEQARRWKIVLNIINDATKGVLKETLA